MSQHKNESHEPKRIPFKESAFDLYCELTKRDIVNKISFPGCSKIFPFEPENFEFSQMISANHHIVKYALFKPLRHFMAVKIINLHRSYQHDPDSKQRYTNLKREIENLSNLKCSPNIVDFYGICLHDSEAWLCMEFMNISLKELYLRIHEEESIFAEHLLGVIAAQIINGVDFMYDKRIMHRDIKPQNILLNEKGQVKICDFGVSRVLEGFYYF